MLSAALTMTSCGTTVSGVTDASCTVFRPIGWSVRDTPQTIREVKEHNAAWEAICRKSLR